MRDKEFQELLQGVREGAAFLRGERKPSRVFEVPSRIKSIREDSGQTQMEFAKMLQIPVSTLRNWEQGRRLPKGPANTLLMLVEKFPKQTIKLLRQSI